MKTCKALILLLLLTILTPALSAQGTGQVSATPKVDVYYFHPNERCPIDEAIEANTIKLVGTDFAAEVKAGVLRLQVLNTDESATNAIAEKFDINTQALYIVKNGEDNKEEKINLTDFAFANAKNNPTKFMDRVKEEILKALK